MTMQQEQSLALPFGALVNHCAISGAPVPVAVVVSVFDDLLAEANSADYATRPRPLGLDDIVVDDAGMAQMRKPGNLTIAEVSGLLRQALSGGQGDDAIPPQAWTVLSRTDGDDSWLQREDTESLRRMLRDALGTPASRDEVSAIVVKASDRPQPSNTGDLEALPVPEPVDDHGDSEIGASVAPTPEPASSLSSGKPINGGSSSILDAASPVATDYAAPPDTIDDLDDEADAQVAKDRGDGGEASPWADAIPESGQSEDIPTERPAAASSADADATPAQAAAVDSAVSHVDRLEPETERPSPAQLAPLEVVPAPVIDDAPLPVPEPVLADDSEDQHSGIESPPSLLPRVRLKPPRRRPLSLPTAPQARLRLGPNTDDTRRSIIINNPGALGRVGVALACMGLVAAAVFYAFGMF